jgi:hypothetical protein
MNRKSLLAFAAFATIAAGAARADDITVDTTPFQSTLSRAQVQADLAQYKQAGVNPWSMSYNPLKGFASARSRDEVRAEYVAHRDEVAALNSEDAGSASLSQVASRSTRNDRTNVAGTPVNGQ